MLKYEWPTQLKKTRVRKEILTILSQADMPLSAMQITNAILVNDNKLWLSTLYRGLEALVSAGVVRRINLTESTFSFYELATHKHSHYAICLRCHKMFAIKNCPLIDYEPLISDEGFAITNHKMEIYGYCGNCQKDEKMTVTK